MKKTVCSHGERHSESLATVMRKPRRLVRLALAAAMAVVAMAVGPLQAHNLDTRATSIHYSADYIALMAQRAGANQPLNQVGDEFWVVIKTTPGPGTTTGVGGYQTFYVPPWAQILDAAYVLPDPADPSGFSPIPMKGQSPIAIGSAKGTTAPVTVATTSARIGATIASGFIAAPAVTSSFVRSFSASANEWTIPPRRTPRIAARFGPRRSWM